jgi:hypothetical protein
VDGRCGDGTEPCRDRAHWITGCHVMYEQSFGTLVHLLSWGSTVYLQDHGFFPSKTFG